MAKYKYTGANERVFPALGITVKSGDEFEAPDNFIANNVVALGKAAAKIETKEETTKSAASDATLGE